jgi:hypothetical protein
MLEEEKSDRDRRLQDMLDEKRHLYKQFTDERRSLDVRVRQLEYDIRYLIGNHSFGSHPCVTPFSNSPLEHTVVHKSNGVENHLIKDFSTYDLDLSNELLSKQRFSDSLWKFKRPADDTATHIAHADDVSPLSGSSSFIDKAARRYLIL